MKQIFAITKKEIQDNIRDKRSLGFALIYPAAFPLYLAFVFFITVSLGSVDFEKESDLHVSGKELAPNLISYLEQSNFNIVDAPDKFEASVENLDTPVVLEISEAFEENLREGLPAPLKVYMTESDNDSDKAYNKIRTVLERYGRSLDQRRLQVRGIDINLFDSINVEKEDVSTEGSSGRAQGLMVPMAIIISMIMGAFYLAIEVTAGEKEKHTLEPLLTLPISRHKMVLGKFLALLAFCLLSLVVAILSFVVVFELIPIDKIPDIFNFNLELISKITIILIPLAAFISALLMLISSFTKSTKEAQTYLGFSIFLFFAPFFIMMWKTIPAVTAVVASPIISQYKLLDMVFKDETITTSNLLLSTGSTLICAALLLWVAIWLYSKDRILE